MLQELELFARARSPVEFLDAGGLAVIEANADKLLDEKGIEVGDIELAAEIWRDKGARVSGNRLHIPGGLARSLVLQHAQPQFVQRGRSRQHDIAFGRGSVVAAPAYGPPYVDKGEGRHLGTVEDFRDILRLADAASVLRHAGGLVGDLGGCPQATRHLHQTAISLKENAKPLLGPAPSAAAYRDALEIARIALGETAESVLLLNLINANSPLRYRKGMFRALVETARLGQGMLLTSYCVPGLTAPVTLAGAMIQGLAEILFGAATAYLVRPEARIIGGIIPIPFSMSSMRPTYGQPLTLAAAFVGAQLIRRLGLPCRVDAGPTSAKLSDAQAGFDAGGAMLAAIDAKADIMLHAAGWLDNGLLFSHAKFADDVASLTVLLAEAGQAPEPTPIDRHVALEIDRYVEIRSREILNSPELAMAYETVG